MQCIEMLEMALITLFNKDMSGCLHKLVWQNETGLCRHPVSYMLIVSISIVLVD